MFYRNCFNCKYSNGGARNGISDMCDSCMNEPDTGWHGYTDNSVRDEYNNPRHFNSNEEFDIWSIMSEDDEDDYF